MNNSTSELSREDTLWQCPKCGILEPHCYTMNGKTRYGRRKCACEEAEAKRLEKEKQHQEWLVMHSGYTYNWTGKRWAETTLQKKTFENFKAGRQLRGYKAACAFASDPNGTLILYGTYGTGKTHLLAAVCNEALHQYGVTSLFTTATKLFAAIQQKIGDHEDYYSLVEQAIKTPLLVIDDIDKAKWTEFREEIYFAIIDERTKRELPTAISTNRLNELANFVGGAVCSRLQIGQIAIEMIGNDFRKEL